jgi:diguanylate cyclase (GGDEF)-like protein
MDITILAAALFIAAALRKLYIAYGKPRMILGMIIGILAFVVSSILDILLTLVIINWKPFFMIENIFIAAGTILSAVSMVIILRYLLSTAKLDPLTGVYNRRHFKELLDIEIVRARRNNLKFAILSCGINGFKLINDKMGHAIGDVVLRNVAQKLSFNVRASDVVARWGGDEFMILFTQTDIAGAKTLVERLNQEIGNMVIMNRNLSISGGLAIFPDDGGTVDEILSLADSRMTNSKNDWNKMVKPYPA